MALHRGMAFSLYGRRRKDQQRASRKFEHVCTSWAMQSSSLRGCVVLTDSVEILVNMTVGAGPDLGSRKLEPIRCHTKNSISDPTTAPASVSLNSLAATVAAECRDGSGTALRSSTDLPAYHHCPTEADMRFL